MCKICNMEYVKAKQLIKDSGVTQKDVAMLLGYTRQHLGEVLNGKIPAGKSLAVKLYDWSQGQLSVKGLMWIK